MTRIPRIAEASLGWKFDNSYARLPAMFYHALSPVTVAAPRVAVVNEALAQSLGLDFSRATQQMLAAQFSGNQLPAGAKPLAQAYAGHQFGHFAVLGDGRAILLGEHITPSGARVDMQLKGSGPTPFSRRGDGRAALGPMLREYIISEAMAGLGIPTTRSLAVVLTGEPVLRETLLAGAVLTRIAASHLRVGTFEWVAAREDQSALKILADYAIARHYPECRHADNPYLALLSAVMERQASLIAAWLHVGFIHGVMNTDNMAISGETIDYGPCAFMDGYDPATVFSSIDHHGRYAYANQPHMAQWNLARFAETLLPLFAPSLAQAIAFAEEAIEGFGPLFQRHWLTGMRKKFGLLNEEADDLALIGAFLQCLQRVGADYTNSLRMLSSPLTPDYPLYTDSAFQHWYASWQARLTRQPHSLELVHAFMRANNPAVIARNHQVEAVLHAATQEEDFTPMHRLLAALARPYEENPMNEAYRQPPPPGSCAYQTFCGT